MEETSHEHYAGWCRGVINFDHEIRSWRYTTDVHLELSNRRRPASFLFSVPVQGDYLRRGVAEFVGAFALTFVGVGAVMTGAGGLVGVALAHGLVIAVMVSAVGHISGGHFN